MPPEASGVRFRVRDDESGEILLVAGWISGLTGRQTVVADGEGYHRLSLRDVSGGSTVLPASSPNLLIEPLNRRGQILGSYPLQVKRSSIVEDHLELIGELLDPALEGAAEVWALWADGPPTAKNEWAPLPFRGRRAWLHVAASSCFCGPLPAAREGGRAFALDGRFVTDYPSFFLAIGEAVNGPGGYFGRNLDALADCLRGGFGAEPPFTLRWRDSAVARSRLTAAALRAEWTARDAHARGSSRHELREAEEEPEYEADPGDALFEEILSILREGGVAVLLE